jgi:uncharacterized protein (DUF486 family)
MQVSTQQPHGLMQYVIPLAIFAIVFSIRARRMARVRPLKLEHLWIVPAIYGAVCVIMLIQFPPTPLGWLACLVALAVGSAVGWQRGRMMHIDVDPETHALSQRASIWGIALLLVIVALRFVARTEAGALHLDVAMLTDSLVVFALGLFSVTRLEMYVRARRLLAEAGAARA